MSGRAALRNLALGAASFIALVSAFLLLEKASVQPTLAQSSSSSLFLPIVFNRYPIQTVFGIEMSSIDTANGLSQVAAANTTWVRRNALTWADVEPSPGVRDWSAMAALENDLRNASAAGLSVILVVRRTPTWAQKLPGSYCGPIMDDAGAFAKFGAFMRDAVLRYSGPPFNVKYWEIWNEPDAAVNNSDLAYGCWGNPADLYYGGPYYARLLKAAYPQIKSADREAQVLVGGLLLGCDPRNPAQGQDCGGSRFLDGILQAGGGPYFDGVSYHAYDFYGTGLGQYSNGSWYSAWNSTGPVSVAKALFLKQVLANHGVTGKYLMNTESALLCEVCAGDATFEATKAYYVAQVYGAAIAQGLRANVWYSVLGWRNSGLLNPDLSPRPAFTAYQFARGELRDAAFQGNVTSSDVSASGVAGFKFDRRDRHVWLIWSLDGAAHNITLPGTPLAAWDVLGNPITPAASMSVDLMPVYLEFP